MRNDPERLAALQALLVLDTAPDRAYDDITRMLADTLSVPITMVSLLDRDRDWFKSTVGMPLSESPAATSFCERFFYTADDLVMVEDTADDEMFKSHPLVVGPPHVRFYAAARLSVGGKTLGTLCAYDLKPRRVSPEQVERMKFLAGNAMSLLVDASSRAG